MYGCDLGRVNVQNANLSYLENLSDLQYEYTYSSSTRTVVVHVQ